MQADVSDPESARALVEEAGDLDILVNNAGVDARRPPRAHVGRGLEHGHRHESRLVLLHVPRGRARDDEEARRHGREHLVDRRHPRELGADELRGVEGGDHRLHEVACARARQPERSRERRRSRLREDAAHGRPPRGGDGRDAPEHAARPSRRRRRTSRARCGSSARTRRRSSRARCCWSTADWGCSGGRRIGQRASPGRHHRRRDGDPARERSRVDVGEPRRGRVGRGPDHALRHGRLRRPLRVRAEGLRADHVDGPQAGATHGPLLAARAVGSAHGRGGQRHLDRRRSQSAWARRSRPGSVASTPSRTASRACSNAGRTARARSRSSRSSRTWPPRGSRWSSAHRARSRPSAPRAQPRTWRSATGSTRSGSVART